MRQRYYILQPDHTVTQVTDLLTWARWFETADRMVARTRVGSIIVSTVFLGLDHQWGDGPPLLFETMIFGGDDEIQKRHSSWADAERYHAALVHELRRIEETPT